MTTTLNRRPRRPPTPPGAEEVERPQRDLVAKEHQAAVAEALSRATYEMERPLVSVSIYVEEMLRLISRAPAGEEGSLSGGTGGQRDA